MVMPNPGEPIGGLGGDAAGGFGALFEQAQKMQAAVIDAQRELAEARVEGSAGGGLVTATVNGGGELVDLKPTEGSTRTTPRPSPTWCWPRCVTPRRTRTHSPSRRWRRPPAGWAACWEGSAGRVRSARGLHQVERHPRLRGSAPATRPPAIQDQTDYQLVASLLCRGLLGGGAAYPTCVKDAPSAHPRLQAGRWVVWWAVLWDRG
ncbi:hypothetical protein FRACA_3920003 [Frankia canadensis]|uniref:Nucleoid-associated protein n=1 Tax=Frankia canadensis TaxID=1836972 RepID=A0A2I2KWB2_9ACTN|nr:hypothetical protein FRACA_3920003 [Frankia canadensis]SOU57234.1 hypothetical protein FRACA_3920003 [Frankia canadensis]